MHTSTYASTVLLLACAVGAQTTIQVSRASVNPGGPNTPLGPTSAGACVQVCVQGNCRPCTTSDGIMSIPPGETPISMGSTFSSPSAFSPVRTSTGGSASASASASGAVPVSSGETPLSSRTKSKASAATSVSGMQSTPIASSTGAVPAQTSNAASPAFDRDGTSFVLAVAGAAIALL